MRDSPIHWQKILADGFTSTQALLEYLHIPLECGSPLAEAQFKTQVPKRFAAKMEQGNPKDPLLLQVLATAKELNSPPEFSLDPLKEVTANPIPGLIHKYAGRVLLTLTGVCAINCRFCFRRHFPYAENNPGQNGWQQAIEYIATNDSIHEVILSGGDPLLASDTTLERLITQLTPITHVKTIRLHSRIPVVLPERIQSHLLDIIDTQRFHVVTVLHCNHPRELDDAVRDACVKMKTTGWTLLNQSVLLRHVNHQPETLVALSHKLFQFGVLPYYLHLLDPVQGAHHFDIPLAQALSIYTALQRDVPGYLLPRLVRETAGIPYKTIVSNNML
ncbi:MAG: EF-P beta-lysylation protein EpmB [Gammaproteobacteria bacterium]|nr:EF-P beta-lysylation protein EpmB [Gammaproteobacteria bacterium]